VKKELAAADGRKTKIVGWQASSYKIVERAVWFH